jgi:hypothetical protein
MLEYAYGKPKDKIEVSFAAGQEPPEELAGMPVVELIERHKMLEDALRELDSIANAIDVTPTKADAA